MFSSPANRAKFILVFTAFFLCFLSKVTSSEESKTFGPRKIRDTEAEPEVDNGHEGLGSGQPLLEDMDLHDPHDMSEDQPEPKNQGSGSGEIPASSSTTSIDLNKVDLSETKENEPKPELGDISSSSSTTTTNIPWLDLDMKLPGLKEGDEPERISELNLELRFDDNTPPTTMTITDPNITWSSKEEEHQILSIQQPLMSPIPISSTEKPMAKPEVNKEPQVISKESETCSCLDLDSIIEALKINDVILQGSQGPQGPRGLPGLSIEGPKGEIGPPGYCSKNCEMETGSVKNINRFKGPSSSFGQDTNIPPEGLYKIVPGALVFPTRSAMLQMKEFSFVGTVAYVETDEQYYGRVKNGWRSFSMGRIHRTFLASNHQRGKLPNDQVKCGPSSVLSSGACIEVDTKNSKPSSPFRGNQQNKPVPAAIVTSLPIQNDGPFQLKSLQIPDSDSQPKKSPETTSTKTNHRLIIDSTPINPARLVALNSPQTGDMNGLKQIGYQCQRQAMKVNLHGIFRAFLSPNDISRLETTVTNLKNETVFNSFDELVNKHYKKASSRVHSTIYAFNGKNVFEKAERFATVWGNINNNFGLDYGTNVMDCQGWGSNDPGLKGSVSNIFDRSPLNKRRFEKCETKLTVLCLEVLHLHQVHLRHKNNNKIRLSFDKYLAILEAYDNSLRLS